MIKEVTAWHDKHSKPVLVTEYGAGALAGLHTVFERQSLMGHYTYNSQNFWIRHLIQDPPVVWTEDYQVVLMEQNFKAFDQLREMGFLIGEMIWNFADFATPQGKWYFYIVLSWLIKKVSVIHAYMTIWIKLGSILFAWLYLVCFSRLKSIYLFWGL